MGGKAELFETFNFLNMVKQVTMYTLICDGCGADLNSGFGEAVAWSDVESNLEVADCSDWLTLNTKHYCPDCWVVDDLGNRVRKGIDNDPGFHPGYAIY